MQIIKLLFIFMMMFVTLSISAQVEPIRRGGSSSKKPSTTTSTKKPSLQTGKKGGADTQRRKSTNTKQQTTRRAEEERQAEVDTQRRKSTNTKQQTTRRAEEERQTEVDTQRRKSTNTEQQTTRRAEEERQTEAKKTGDSGLAGKRTITSATGCPDDNHPHAIDLGLPSGTKWACCNVEASKPEDYGGYYAWGEMKEKSSYFWNNYTHRNGSDNICDNLGSQYDVAHMKWGGTWVMPSIGQLEELLKYCTSEWTIIKGVKGRKFTGKNGGAIFLPAASYRYDSDLGNAGSNGGYWSSTQYPSSAYYAYYLYFYSDGTYTNYGNRNNGLSVRPVVRN